MDGGWYHGFTPSFIFSATGSAGYISGWGGDYVRINDRFFEGGNSFNGFQLAGVQGPPRHKSELRPGLGRKMYAIRQAQSRPSPTACPEQYGIKMAAFLQSPAPSGCSTMSPRATRTPTTSLPTIRDDPALRASAGISIFWKSPLGPIEIDLSDPFLKTSYDKTQSFNFTTSTRF